MPHNATLTIHVYPTPHSLVSGTYKPPGYRTNCRRHTCCNNKKERSIQVIDDSSCRHPTNRRTSQLSNIQQILYKHGIPKASTQPLVICGKGSNRMHSDLPSSNRTSSVTTSNELSISSADASSITSIYDSITNQNNNSVVFSNPNPRKRHEDLKDQASGSSELSVLQFSSFSIKST